MRLCGSAGATTATAAAAGAAGAAAGPGAEGPARVAEGLPGAWEQCRRDKWNALLRETKLALSNSPLYQYLQDLGHTDFEVCSAVPQKAEPCAAAAAGGQQEWTTRAAQQQGILSKLAEVFRSWFPFPQYKKNDDILHRLDVGFRCDTVRAILQQEVLLQEDVELIELLDPSILSAGQCRQQEHGRLPTLCSLATPNIWDVSLLLAFLSALLALPSWCEEASGLLGGLLLLAYASLRVWGTWRTARLQMALRKHCLQLEETVANSRAFTNLVRKALRLIQETEEAARYCDEAQPCSLRGLRCCSCWQREASRAALNALQPEPCSTTCSAAASGAAGLARQVSAACPFNKAGQHPSQQLLGLRKAVYRSVRANFRASRLATLYMLKNYPLNSESDNVTNYICVVPFKELGLGLSEEQVSEEEAHNLTDGFSLPALKVLFQLWVGQSSEFFRRLVLLLSPANASPQPLLTPDTLPHHVLSDVTQGLPHTHAACLEELKRSYEFHRYFETQHQSGFERAARKKQKSKELNSLHTAVRSLQLHLKALLNEVIILEDELEKLVSTKETQELTTEAHQVLEQKLKYIQPHIQASNSCWEEAISQVEKMNRRNPDKKGQLEASWGSIPHTAVPLMQPALHIEDKDPIPEEQELEAYVDDSDMDSEYKREDFYCFSEEERERQKREREESKRVLQELKSVLGFKASEAERQKWKQLLFSDHAAVTPLSPLEPLTLLNNLESPPNSGAADQDCSPSCATPEERDWNPSGSAAGESRTERWYEDAGTEAGGAGAAGEGVCAEAGAGGSRCAGEAGEREAGDVPGAPCPPRSELRQRLAQLHAATDWNFTAGLAAQAAARSLTFTTMQEQTFGDEEEEEEKMQENENLMEEGENEGRGSENGKVVQV